MCGNYLMHLQPLDEFNMEVIINELTLSTQLAHSSQ